ncbi:hypothetical protein B0T10DRAFT_502678 [Thelonectria olida]|uniref:Zn(2)-C6 fungal-type domain-containing protein n=1 Tax=Thelonectria olida TaxID=1576542 RepID=A0A9P8VPQ3_9HYPO|nr:hypothetical protein B0T10DRAFT_502678 [Thelonectria olida]
MASSIQIFAKASNICLSCRVRKQKCDRALPKCSRCAAKLKRCDYTAQMNLSGHAYNDQPAEALVHRRSAGYDLSWRGSIGLLRATHEIHEPSFLKLVYHILDLTSVTIPSLLEDYLATIHPWFPVLGKDQLQATCFNLSTSSKPLSSLLLLVLLLVTRHPCGPEDHPGTSVLYTTLKQLGATLRPIADSYCDLLQCNLLIALYECGQGLTNEAFLTLSSSVALNKLNASFVTQTRSGETNNPDVAQYERIILILDRTIFWSDLNRQTPLICPSQEPIGQGFQSGLPPLAQNSSDGALERLRLTSQVALISGRALQYIYDAKGDGTLPKEYDALARGAGNMVADLMREKESHSWMFCDGIAMGLSYLVALHQTAVRQTNAPKGSKEYLALRSSRCMAWDMCKISMDMIKPSNVSQLSFVGMCHVFRAAVIISEAFGDDVTAEELEELLPTLCWFSERWAVGVEYLTRIKCSIKFLRK